MIVQSFMDATGTKRQRFYLFFGDNRREMETHRLSSTYMTDAPVRPAAPVDESVYTLSVEDAANRYAAAGFPRPIRRLQKYCARGDLECRKVETPTGEKYLITPESIARHIAYIKETSGRAQARPDAPERRSSNDVVSTELKTAPERAPTRPAAPERAPELVKQLEKRIEEKNDEIRFLRSEVSVKNAQIKELTERARETNVLIAGLQKMFGLQAPKGDNAEQNLH